MASSGRTATATATSPMPLVPSAVAQPLPVLLVLLVMFAVGCGSLNATVTTIEPLMAQLVNGMPPPTTMTTTTTTLTMTTNASYANATLADVEASADDGGDDDGTTDGWFEVFKLVLKASIMLLIIIASICGNLLVIVSVMRVRKLR